MSISGRKLNVCRLAERTLAALEQRLTTDEIFPATSERENDFWVGS